MFLKKMLSSFFAVFLLVLAVVNSSAMATGGTLYPILQWIEAMEDGNPAPEHSVETEKLPTIDKPFSSKDLVKNGKVVTRRYYGENGKAKTDIDYTDHGNPKQHPKVPHRHDWTWNGNTPTRGPWY